MKEVVVFLDLPAGDAVALAASFLAERGVPVTDRAPLSVAFAAGQFAAVPVQLKPEWCRVWATAWGDGEAEHLVDEFAARHRERSRVAEAQVKAIEADVYSEASWPAYEQRLRASLSGGAGVEEVEAKIAAVKKRWLALGKRAGAAPEEHLSA
ncbi:MAG TPA: hypothetical protein VFX49_10850 [Chloroflexota bacterium]|nr:hypothetical protein [Chloroflexota bacterium]